MTWTLRAVAVAALAGPAVLTAPNAWAGPFGTSWAAPWEQPSVVTLDPLRGRVCEKCDLSARMMSGARLSDGKFGGSDFSSSSMERANGANSVFDEADFTRADLSQAKLMKGQFVRARFAGAVMRGADASGANLERADFTNAELGGATFSQASLNEARFLATRARDASLLRAGLRRADFTLAILQGADFSGADLYNAQFDRANLSGANLADARNLTQKQLRNACGDGETRLPTGLSVQPCH